MRLELVASIRVIRRLVGSSLHQPFFPVWVTGFSSAILLIFSALFSGLTLGLMSLDVIGLDIIAQAGDPDERKYAKIILPVRSKGNLLLCTLLLGNTAGNIYSLLHHIL